MRKTFFIALLMVMAMGSLLSAADVHAVVAQKPLYLADGSTGTWYENLTGCCTITWKEKSRYGFFNAKVQVPNSLIPLTYEFQLVSIANCDGTILEGLFDVKRNGVLVASGIVGKLYGIDQPVGSYFKFYGGDSTCYAELWHVSAYITSRVDY